MSSTQAWLLVGIPGLVIGIVLYTARSRWLGLAGFFVLLAAVLAMVTVERMGAMVLGVVIVLLYAAGRAGQGGVVGEDPVRPPADRAHAD
jgi:hypothetical protein